MIRNIMLGIIRFYQIGVSPFLGPHCRFTPSCSHYAQVAIQQYGVGKGSYLALKRICRCHPWSVGGYDPLP